MGRYSTGHLLQDTPVLSQPANAARERLRGRQLPKCQNVEANTFRRSISEPAEGRWESFTKVQGKLFPPTSKETYSLSFLNFRETITEQINSKTRDSSSQLLTNLPFSSSKLVSFQPINKTTCKHSYRASNVRLYVLRVIVFPVSQSVRV